MRFAAALSTHASLDGACREAARDAREALGPGPVDLCVAFVAAGYAALERAPVLLMEELDARTLIGCSGGGIIGGGREVEGRRAVSVVLARMPGVGLHALHWGDGDLPSEDAPPSAWIERVG